MVLYDLFTFFFTRLDYFVAEHYGSSIPIVPRMLPVDKDQDDAVCKLVGPHQTVVAMVIYFQVALTGFSVLGLSQNVPLYFKGNEQHRLSV